MSKLTCFLSLAIYLGIAGFYWYLLYPSVELLPAVLLSLFLALFAAAGIATLKNSIQLQKKKRLFSDAESGQPLQDGKKVLISGKLEPIGFPARTPFEENECLIYEYKIAPPKSGDDAGSDFTGIKMVPSAIHSTRGNIRVIGFPFLQEEYKLASGPNAQENARRFVQSTKFEKGSIFSAGKMIKGILDAWRDEDGVVQKDWRLSKDETVKEGSELRERYISPGESVVAIGKYSATQGGLIAPSDDSIEIIVGNIEKAKRELGYEKQGSIVTGIVFFLAAQFFVGAIYFMTEKREAWSSPQQQVGHLHSAVSKGDFKLIGRLKRSDISLDLKDSAGRTPLMITDDLAMSKYLLENGANVNAVNPETDETPIFLAARNGNEELLRLYITHGAKTQVVSKIPWEHTPLNTAIESGQNDCAKVLMEQGAYDDRVDSINGQAIVYGGGEPFELIQNYHAAIQEHDLQALKDLTTLRASGFFESADYRVWKYYYPMEIELVEGYANDSAATVVIQGITPDATSQRWSYQLIRSGDRWKIARIWEPK